MTSQIETKRAAIITGGSRGMGRNTAVNLARRGVDVIFTYHSNQAEAGSLIREIEAIGRKAAAFRLDTGVLSAFDGFAADVRKALDFPCARARQEHTATGSKLRFHAPHARHHITVKAGARTGRKLKLRIGPNGERKLFEVNLRSFAQRRGQLFFGPKIMRRCGRIRTAVALVNFCGRCQMLFSGLTQLLRLIEENNGTQ